MKKYVLVFTILALLQVSCSKDDDGLGFKKDRVFQESQFLGNWRRIATLNGDNWIGDAETCQRAFIAFKEKNVLEEFSCDYLKSGNGWTFDGKNVLKFETKDSTRYQLNLTSINEMELIADAHVVLKDGSEKKATWLYEKKDFDLDEYYNSHTRGYRVKDVTDFMYIGVSETYVAGLKDNKLWVGHFDAETKEQIYERKDKEDFISTKSIHVGYGEYKTLKINSIHVNKSYSDLLFALEYYWFGEQTNYTSNILWFSESGKKIDCENGNFSVIPWYNKSYIIRYNNSVACLSHEGDSILSGSEFYFPSSKCEFYPINYNYFIAAASSTNAIYLSVNQVSDDGNTAWSRGETKIEAEQSNFKYTATVVEKNRSIWKFKVDITEYSGKQHSRMVDIDVSGID